MQNIFDFIDDLLENLDFENEEPTADMLVGADQRRAVRLDTLNPGDEFEINDIPFIVLGGDGHGGVRVIQKNFLDGRMQFGQDADWKNSPTREMLNTTYYRGIADAVGSENIKTMIRDLTSRDGLDDYGICDDKVILLSEAEYVRKIPQGSWCQFCVR